MVWLFAAHEWEAAGRAYDILLTLRYEIIGKSLWVLEIKKEPEYEIYAFHEREARAIGISIGVFQSEHWLARDDGKIIDLREWRGR
jgi:hypothetical protein